MLEVENKKKGHLEADCRYHLIVENSSEAIFILQDNRICFPNKKAKEIMDRIGFDPEKSRFPELVHEKDRQMVNKLVQSSSTPYKSDTVPSFRLASSSGERIWAELNRVLVTWEDAPVKLIFIRDISELKKLEAQLHATQRMESIGTLAGGIAHDFNNLLMGIQGNIALMQLDVDTGHKLYENIDKIEKCVDSGSALTKQLLGFARGGKYVVVPLDINALLQSSSKVFGRTRKEIKIHGNYLKSLWAVEGDHNQIEQIFVNLYLNAFQAMTGGGDIYLRTDNVSLDHNMVKPHGLSPGDYVKISITDTGTGMTSDVKKRIFDPFFTTREVGCGTGLGLASVFGIIKNHGGFIDVESDMGEGSSFFIYLPASKKALTKEKEPPKERLRGTETILIIDDEDYIIHVGRLMLEGLGYKVFDASCGRAGIDVFLENYNKIDLVILDMIMPDLNGEEVYNRIKTLKPDIKVLIASGYNVDFHASSMLEEGCNGFIQKPYNLNKLSIMLRQVLDC